MKTINLKDKNTEELTSLLKEHRETLRTLRFSAAMNRPKDATEPTKTRKQIARLLTELGSRAA